MSTSRRSCGDKINSLCLSTCSDGCPSGVREFIGGGLGTRGPGGGPCPTLSCCVKPSTDGKLLWGDGDGGGFEGCPLGGSFRCCPFALC